MSTEEAIATLVDALGAEFAGPVAPPEREVIVQALVLHEALAKYNRERQRRSWYLNRGLQVPVAIVRGIRLRKAQAVALGASRSQLGRPFGDTGQWGLAAIWGHHT